MLTAVASSAIGAYLLLCSAGEQSFSRVTLGLNAPQRAANARHRVTPASHSYREVSDATESARLSLWLVLVVTVVPLVAVGSFVAIRRRRRRRRDEPMKPPDAAPMPKPFRKSFAEKRQQILRMLSDLACAQHGDSVEVRHLMTAKLTTVPADLPVEQLRDLMKDVRVRHLMVLGEDDELLGLVSDRDLAERDGNFACEMMTRTLITVNPDTPASQAISAMLTHRFSCVPVVDEGRLCGVLTTSDLIMALQCTLQLLVHQATTTTGRATGNAAGGHRESAPSASRIG